ncbi:MAG TPA: hypothetical protein VMT85_04430 [Thermoanaerobaculia bacterium]|nr:hypothetical protein [Thermoanaerobaculia bacterium]
MLVQDSSTRAVGAALPRSESPLRIAAAVVALACLISGAPLGAAEIKVGGLQVVAAGFGKDGSELTAFNSSNPGTTFYLVVDAGSPGQVVEILDDECAVTSMTDDTGKNLLEGVDWGSFPDVSEDKRYGAIELTTNGRPAAGATKIMVSGTFAYQTSEGSDVHEVKKFGLSQGAEVEWQTGKARIGEVVKSEWSEGIEVNLEMTAALRDQIKAVRFYDASGAVIETSASGYMVMGNEATLSYSLEKSADEVSMEIETWKGLKAELVPFELTIGLGI